MFMSINAISSKTLYDLSTYEHSNNKEGNGNFLSLSYAIHRDLVVFMLPTVPNGTIIDSVLKTD